MQLDPAITRPTSSDPHPPVKRPFSHQAVLPQPRASFPTAPPAKKPRSASPLHQKFMPSFPNRHRPSDAGPSSQSRRKPPRNQPKSKARPLPSNLLDGPFHDEDYIEREHKKSPIPLKPVYKNTPKSAVNNFYSTAKNLIPEYVSVQRPILVGDELQQIWRTTVTLDIEPQIVGIGDSKDKKQSTHLAALSAVYQLQELGILDPKKLVPAQSSTETTLSDGSVLAYSQARSFMDYYCRQFNFDRPDIEYLETKGAWEAIMTVGGRRIGLGAGANKKTALTTCYLDVTKYLESCDPELWKTYVEAAKTGKDLGMGPRVSFNVSHGLGDAIGDVCYDIRKTALYRNRPSREAIAVPEPDPNRNSRLRRPNLNALEARSRQLWDRRQAYLVDKNMAKMRQTRMALPVYGKAKEVLQHIENNEVTILMAATGSGKTTQIPQIILDEYIERQEGSSCNIICTQPRRLAAISVADRIAKERGEVLGQSIGYQVRFDAKLPERGGGSVTFCTTGIFLKRLQSALSGGRSDPLAGNFDDVTHIIVDEVHERDIDTDLLLVVLKQLMAQKKAKKQSFKIILMSATIDPTLFQEYFKDETGTPAKVISIPGRSFPVTKYFMDDYLPKLLSGPMKWMANEENVAQYIHRELGPVVARQIGASPPRNESRTEDIELPYPLIAATVSNVLQTSDDGHVLVFLPGWDEIIATQKALLSPLGPLPINFNSQKYSIHLLHSTIPLAEQQAIFEPPPPGVRRVILATNIAETSVTIPDVVYVIDTAKVKEQRYDPDRHMSSLVSAWVGSSNLNQRAGRAGRHRSGEYFGILSKQHAEALHPHQTVEMKRVDLSNVVMHVKALNFPGMSVEDVLAAAIEPPDSGRVEAAMKNLQMVGALDSGKNLTSLGRVLLQIPVDAQMGRLVLYGSFFRCLDPALTLAAILTNRDPFMTPMHLKEQARKAKNSWVTEEFRSDPLTTLKAFDAWWAMQSRGEYVSANRFCIDNFLSKPTLLMIQKIKTHLLQSLYRAGVIAVSAGGAINKDEVYNLGTRGLSVPAALNTNKDSYPLLTALITIASQPKFAVRVTERSFRTITDKTTSIHPSSVNHSRKERTVETESTSSVPRSEKQLFAFSEKRRNDTSGANAQTFLVGTTRLDPLTYILFGAYNVDVVERGLECDGWLPIVGDVRVLDEIQRLKKSMESCMLRVFEGITMSRQRPGQQLPIIAREDTEEEFDPNDDNGNIDYSLSSEEVRDLDLMTRDIVSLLNRHSDERIASQSRQTSRAPTPLFGSPLPFNAKLPGAGSISGYSTPAGHNMFQSRPGTPSRFRRM
ncbi:ATP-dependent DNA/RNA helicase DHX36 [Psilocybe cubensis]|uniref:ATP-dependent DNA/RNA helicase DHX36 n=2 Tax=Psilocybe cubensis TaxID=181762 RepID=A0ACB8HGG7_PSICU|nr:ATP-dependent DNA/RNA helicase DHX36 [Psilocybe cubensis]KAH9486931.1 ATP-dependent DNA/RNA helicase DHX36 [Psilocybe cubensis]